MSQEYVNKISKSYLKEFKNIPTSKAGRIYFTQKDDVIRIYLYSRDINELDLWFIFKHK